jgi:hypothetical protein
MTNTSRDLGALSGPHAGAAAMLSPLSLIIGPAVRLIPAARTSGLVVTGVVGVLLGRSGQTGRESP